MTKSLQTAVIGLGSMGYGMAQSLLRSGHVTHGFDVTSSKMDLFMTEGGAPGALSDVAPKLQAVVCVVLNAAQTECVLFGNDGIAPKLPEDAVILSCATVAPDFAHNMEARCAALGVHYLDSPISGGALKASQGRLSIMASGTPTAFATALPILDSLAETVFELGDKAGAGSAMKATNQLLAGVHIAAMAEAITFGITQGITPDTFLDVISKCAGTSWMLENRAPHIVSGDYTPRSSVNIWPKDLGIVTEMAAASGFAAPITQTALAQFQSAADLGFGLEDDAAVAKVYAHRAGLTLPEENT